VILADGFSCREQIEQGTDRAALHLAEVMQLALHRGRGGVEGPPEWEAVAQRQARQRRLSQRTMLGIAVGAAAGAAIWFALAERKRRAKRY
jgi:hypothetical protein